MEYEFKESRENKIFLGMSSPAFYDIYYCTCFFFLGDKPDILEKVLYIQLEGLIVGLLLVVMGLEKQKRNDE